MNAIEKAVDDLHVFLESDLYTKFRPEQKIKGKSWYREDVFQSEKEFDVYLKEHFDILRKQLRELLGEEDEG